MNAIGMTGIAVRIASEYLQTGLSGLKSDKYDNRFAVDEGQVYFETNGRKYGLDLEYEFDVEGMYRNVWTGVRDTEEYVGYEVTGLRVVKIKDMYDMTGDEDVEVDSQDEIYKSVESLENVDFRNALEEDAKNWYDSYIEYLNRDDED